MATRAAFGAIRFDCGSRLMVVMRRICKALMLGETYIKAVKFKSYVEPDYIGVEADELPY